MANPKLNAISLCSGVGMLDEGVRAGLEFLGITLRTVAYAEWEAPAATQLIALMEAGCLDEAPVWCGDIRQINAGKFRGVVDCVIAGFPCQDLSIAGRRAGLDGKRSGLFFRVCDIADDCDAQYLLLENVSAIASATATVMDEAEGELEERAAARVMGELADRGWNAEWITISASDVGASHRRARWFCFAWRDVADTESRGRGERQRQEFSRRAEIKGAGEYMGHARLQHQHSEQRADGAEHQGAGGAVADTENANRRSEQQPCGTGRWRGRLAGIGSGMADPGSEGRQGREQCRTRIDNRGGAGSTWIN